MSKGFGISHKIYSSDDKYIAFPMSVKCCGGNAKGTCYE